jgi:hypothetical protein
LMHACNAPMNGSRESNAGRRGCEVVSTREEVNVCFCEIMVVSAAL